MPISDLMTNLKDTLASCPEFLSRISGSPAAADRIYFVRNEDDLDADKVMNRPFFVIDFPVINWVEDGGDRCFKENTSISFDIHDSSDTDEATTDSLREMDYIEAVIRHIKDNVSFRISSIVQSTRPNIALKIQRTPDDLNDYWMSGYTLQVSTS